VRLLNQSGKLDEYLNDNMVAAYRLGNRLRQEGKLAKDQIE